jgi:pimeloyl-ACP methyl ester carboxylesterase
MSAQNGTHGTIEEITGQYVYVDVDGTTHRVYYEENGPEDGIPILCQHTAGTNNGEWRHLLANEDVTEDFRVIAYDLPYHGKSVPPNTEQWWQEDYLMDARQFADTIVGISDALDLDDPIFLGSSMGGTITLELGDWYPEEFRALIGLETGAHCPGFFIDWLAHPEVNITEVASYSAWGLMPPEAPEWARRETMYQYEQGANGILRGDLYYYSVDHDYRDSLDQIDATECPMYLMNGEYDFLTPPEDAREVAEGIGEGATAVAMEKLGHFPMCEHPDLFHEYIQLVLDDIVGDGEGSLPDTFTPELVDFEG